MNIHYSLYSQQHKTQRYNKNIADLILSIIDLLTIRSPIWRYNYRMNNYYPFTIAE